MMLRGIAFCRKLGLTSVSALVLCVGPLVQPPAWAHAAVVQKATGPAWAGLTANQQTALAPLKAQWAEIDADRKSKWLILAERFPLMSAGDQRRMQDRMAEWSRLTPIQRAQTRLQFQETRSASPQEKQDRWEQYQRLSPEQKAALQSKAATVKAKTAESAVTVGARDAQKTVVDAKVEPNAKAVTAPAAIPAPRLVNPVVVQAKTGATTTLLSKTQPDVPRGAAQKPQGLMALPHSFDHRTLLPKDGATPQRLSKARESASAPASTQR